MSKLFNYKNTNTTYSSITTPNFTVLSIWISFGHNYRNINTTYSSKTTPEFIIFYKNIIDLILINE